MFGGSKNSSALLSNRAVCCLVSAHFAGKLTRNEAAPQRMTREGMKSVSSSWRKRHQVVVFNLFNHFYRDGKKVSFLFLFFYSRGIIAFKSEVDLLISPNSIQIFNFVLLLFISSKVLLIAKTPLKKGAKSMQEKTLQDCRTKKTRIQYITSFIFLPSCFALLSWFPFPSI